MLYFLKGCFRFHARLRNVSGHLLYRRAASLHCLIAAKSSRLKSHEDWLLAVGNNVSIELAQKQPPREDGLVAFCIHANAITYQTFAESRGQFRGEVPHEIGMRHHDVLRIERAHGLLHCGGVGVRSVFGELRMIDINDFLQVVSRDLVG